MDVFCLFNSTWSLSSGSHCWWIQKHKFHNKRMKAHETKIYVYILQYLNANQTMEFSFIISTHNAVLSIILLILICIFYKFNFSVYFFALGWISSILLRYGLIHYYQDNLYLAKSIIVLIPFFLFLISIKKLEGSTIVKHRGD